MGGSLCTGNLPKEGQEQSHGYGKGRTSGVSSQRQGASMDGVSGGSREERVPVTPGRRLVSKYDGGPIREESPRQTPVRSNVVELAGNGGRRDESPRPKRSRDDPLKQRSQRPFSEMRADTYGFGTASTTPTPVAPLPKEYYKDDEDPGVSVSRSMQSSEDHLQHMIENVGPPMESPKPIRWSPGPLIGAGAFGRVYMGMNHDSGELIAVKQVVITSNSTTKEKLQEHVRGLEAEVAVLRNLSHQNIVRYLGTERKDEYLNIFLEFVPGGSIASLLSKFGCFKETVIQRYTRQLLMGLEYLHSHKIMHRDIKGANILVDEKGVIKLADFGASKMLADLATMNEAKSVKGTPYWMAPEVIKQTGHGRQADIWSVGCTVIEMITGKPPWSQFSSGVSALFHIASSKGPPPLPEGLSEEAQDFLLKCFRRDPKERPSASELIKHPFILQGPERKSLATPSVPLRGREVPPPQSAGGRIFEETERSFSRGLNHSVDSDCTPRGFDTVDVPSMRHEGYLSPSRAPTGTTDLPPVATAGVRERRSVSDSRVALAHQLQSADMGSGGRGSFRRSQSYQEQPSPSGSGRPARLAQEGSRGRGLGVVSFEQPSQAQSQSYMARNALYPRGQAAGPEESPGKWQWVREPRRSADRPSEGSSPPVASTSGRSSRGGAGESDSLNTGNRGGATAEHEGEAEVRSSDSRERPRKQQQQHGTTEIPSGMLADFNHLSIMSDMNPVEEPSLLEPVNVVHWPPSDEEVLEDEDEEVLVEDVVLQNGTLGEGGSQRMPGVSQPGGSSGGRGGGAQSGQQGVGANHVLQRVGPVATSGARYKGVASPSPPETPSPLADEQRGLGAFGLPPLGSPRRGEASGGDEEVVTEEKIMDFLQQQAQKFKELMDPLIKEKDDVTLREDDTYDGVRPQVEAMPTPTNAAYGRTPQSEASPAPKSAPYGRTLGSEGGGTPSGVDQGSPSGRTWSGRNGLGATADHASPSVGRSRSVRSGSSDVGGGSSGAISRDGSDASVGVLGLRRNTRNPLDTPSQRAERGSTQGPGLPSNLREDGKKQQWEEELQRDLAFARERRSLSMHTEERSPTPLSIFGLRDTGFSRQGSRLAVVTPK